MKSIFIKEIKTFFSSPIGYIAMAMFFILNTLFLWFIEGSYYIPNYHFADLTPFFLLAPWIYIFVIAAISMKSLSEEFKSGTIEALITKPVTVKQIVLGKFMSIWYVGKLMLIPTLLYVYAIKTMSLENTLDWKNLLSAYFGLILLVGAMAAIGIFSSALFKNQVNAFLVSIFLSFLFYYGFEGLGSFNLLGSLDLFIQKLSLNFHYQNFVKGIIKLSDFVYLISIMIAFVFGTILVLNHKIK